MLLQHGADLVARLWQLDVVFFRLVGRHDRRPAGRGDDGNAAGQWRRGFRKKRGGFQQMLEIIHQYGSRPPERGPVGGVRAGERAGMRHRRRGALLARGHLEQNHRLVGPPGKIAGIQQPPRLRHALKHTGNGGAVRVFDQKADIVGHVDIDRVARCQHMTYRDPARRCLRQRHAERAGLADDADRTRPRLDFRRQPHEGDARVAGGVDDADAVRPDDAQPGLPGDGEQPILLDDAILFAGLGVAGREDDRPPDPGTGAIEHNLLHRLARHADHRAIHGLRQIRDRGITLQIVDPVVAGIHRIISPAIIQQVVQNALPERAGALGSADNRDRSGIEQPRKLRMSIVGAR